MSARTGRQHGHTSLSGAAPSLRQASLGVKSIHYASSPLLTSRTPPWRSRLVVALLGLAFAGLLGRAVWVQAVREGYYQDQGARRTVQVLPLQASRGAVLDRNGQPLASSVSLPSVHVDLKTFAADVSQRKALARALDLPLAELQDRLDGSGTVVLKRHLEEPAWAEVKALKLKGLVEQREFARRYAEGASAAHVVGFTNSEGVGLEGVELAFNTRLAALPGQQTVVRDRLGRVVEHLGERSQAAVPGQDVQLSIDAKVQFFAHQRLQEAVKEHGAKAGSAVVLDARTGEILALANYPSFDPLNRRNPQHDASRAMRNRAITDTFEPGSTMKPFTAALAIDTGRFKAGTPIQTAPGRITVTGAVISDAHPHGVLTVAEVIQKSSNVGTVKMAQQLPAREMWQLFHDVGFGQKPKIGFPGAATGKLRPYKSWRPVEQATMSYGYGLSTSLLQLARAYTVFATDGELVPLTLEKQAGPVQGERVLSAKTARELREMLRTAAAPGGTAPKAMTIGYSVGGKTGTARKQEGKAYGTKYRSWFVGLAPVSDPRIVVAVMVDEPSKGQYYGGDVAAPVFSHVVQETLRTLGVAPDIAFKPQISSPTKDAGKSVASVPESI